MFRRARALVALGASCALLVTLAAPALGRDPDLVLVAGQVVQDGQTLEVAKSQTGKLARTDLALLARTDATRVTVMVKLDYDPVASYSGDVEGLDATSPAVTGISLEKNADGVDAYTEHVAQTEATALDAIQEAVPDLTITRSFRTVYGGFSATVPANEVEELLAVKGVAAVHQDTLQQPLTDSTPGLVGAPDAWEGLGGSTTAGEGVIVGVLDTGIWPEHPSFEDSGDVTAPPQPTEGWACEFGDGAEPELGDAFECNAKLIGAYAFLESYMLFVGSRDGEFCSAVSRQCSARDADGHGTHTASIAAGGPVASAELLGVERGPISGIAPGAHVIAYRVCALQGCFSSDSAAAVEQSVLDGVDVINYSISGGTNPYTDPVELAFLDAYNAGIVVNASAGNEGPGPATANHAAPWVTTVAASTSTRQFLTSLRLSAPDADAPLTLAGATVTGGMAATPVVLAESIAGVDARCLAPLPADSAAGKIVACERGTNARVAKSYNVERGGAAGMILYNPEAQGLNTDNHFLPSVHIDQPNTAAFLAFMANPGVTARWGSAVATAVPADVMAPFSSRGPSGDYLKPDVTAPGVQVLAGHTPVGLTQDGGEPGQLFQATQGTSLSSAHGTGVAALVRAAHPEWTAGQVKSALMTSAAQGVLKEDGETAATPFDRGAGSIRADRAISPTLTFDVEAGEFVSGAGDPLGRVHLNLPSIYANPMPGVLTTSRTAVNVSGRSQEVRVRVDAPAGSSISVTPERFRIGTGSSREITIAIDSTGLEDGTYFGAITLDVNRGSDAVLPVAFDRTQAAVHVTHSCDPASVPAGSATECTVTAVNHLATDAQAALEVAAPRNVSLVNVSAPAVANGNAFTWQGPLSGRVASTIDGISAGKPDGYLALADRGVEPVGGLGDESIANFTVPEFTYGGEAYTRIGFTSNGYAVVGGGIAADVDHRPQALPGSAAPNNILAPYWTDLDFSASGELRVAVLARGTQRWLVADYAEVAAFGLPDETSTFQIWIGLNGVDDVAFDYGPLDLADPDAVTVGAENADGTSGAQLGSAPADGDGWVVDTSPPVPGGSLTVTYDVRSDVGGAYEIPATVATDVMAGRTIERARLEVTLRTR